jgi:hypothetical protein
LYTENEKNVIGENILLQQTTEGVKATDGNRSVETKRPLSALSMRQTFLIAR